MDLWEAMYWSVAAPSAIGVGCMLKSSTTATM
jgi:hypothetical protein